MLQLVSPNSKAQDKSKLVIICLCNQWAWFYVNVPSKNLRTGFHNIVCDKVDCVTAVHVQYTHFQ